VRVIIVEVEVGGEVVRDDAAVDGAHE